MDKTLKRFTKERNKNKYRELEDTIFLSSEGESEVDEAEINANKNDEHKKHNRYYALPFYLQKYYEGWVTPNVYELINRAVYDMKDDTYRRIILDLINKSTTEETRLKTLHNHFIVLINPENLNTKNSRHKIAKAIFNSLTKINTSEYMDVNIFTALINKAKKYYKSINNPKTLKRMPGDLAAFSVNSIKPANPSEKLNKSVVNKTNSNSIELNNKIITNSNSSKLKTTNDLNQNVINPLAAQSLIYKFNILNSEFKKVAKDIKETSRFIEILIAKNSNLAASISSILNRLEEIILYADDHKNELNERLKLMPYAQYQLLVRFIRACAYKQANTPRNKEEVDALLKTEKKEFDLYRKKFNNAAYPGANVRTIFKQHVESFLNGIPLDIDKLFNVYGMY